jgi:general stress protein YciG
MKKEKNQAAVELGRKGGTTTSPKKKKSSSENGKKGGRWSRDKIIKICRETSSKKMNRLLDAQKEYRKLKNSGLVENPAEKQGAFGPAYSEDELRLAKLIDKCGDEGLWGDVTYEANDNTYDKGSTHTYHRGNYIEKIAKLGEKIK